MKVVFLKDGFYRGTKAKGEICEMSRNDIDVYEEFRAVQKYFGKKDIGENIYEDEKKDKSLEDLTLQELKELCLKNELPTKGTKKDLLEQLKLNGIGQKK